MSTSEPENDLLERYLDGLMSDDEAADFLRTADPLEIEQARELENQISGSLRRLISGMEVDEDEIQERFLNQIPVEDRLTTADRAETKRFDKPRRRGSRIALAAALLLALGIGIWFQVNQNGSAQPVNKVRQVAELYRTKVDDGFRPYYVCDDPIRFAETFQIKLGQSLALSDMPTDRRMIGISYLGGVSRKTIAMLAEVQDQPVIIFVDRKDKPGIAEAIRCSHTDLNVFVENKYGLVFIEVTPHATAGMTEYFEKSAGTNSAAQK